MTEALISGQAKTALLIEGHALFSFDVHTPEILTPRRESDFRFLFGEATDFRFLQNIKKKDALKELQFDYDKTLALDLVLLLLDVDISETKQTVAEALEEFLTDDLVIYLESIFYAKPLPDTADTENALSVCKDFSSTAYSWLSRLLEKQYDISEVRKVWDSIPDEIFGAETNRADFQTVFVQEGVFRELVLNCRDGVKLNNTFISAGINNEIIPLQNHRTILQKLFTPFRQSLVSREEKRLQKDEVEETVHQRQKEPRRGGFDRDAAKDNALSQIDYITNFLKKRDIETARTLTDELINSGKGEIVYTVMSLCNLAQTAKELGLYKLQLELTEKSISLDYRDAWAQAQYGDALLQHDRFNEAVKAFENAISFYKFGDNKNTYAVAKTGYAEALKAQGKLNQSLEIYEQIISEDPEDVVAKTGYAEVLKAQGKLDKSLEIYKSTINEHPKNVVARTGYARVLKAKGKLNRSLEIYEQIISENPEDAVAKTGYAEVLKAQGKLNESSDIYKQIIIERPENVITRNGYAEVLKAQGKLDESVDFYEATIKEHPENVVARTGYAEVLKAQGKVNKSLEIYEAAIREYPENVVARTGYAEALKTQGKLSESLEIYEATIKEFPENAVVRNGLCGVLFALKKYDEALEKLPSKELITLGDWIGYHIRGMIFLRKGNLNEAVRIFERGEREDPILSSKEYFRSALAVARLKQGNFKQAEELLEKVTAPLLQHKVNILRLHAYGELKMYPKAENAFMNYEKSKVPDVGVSPWLQREMELVSELKNRYVEKVGYGESNEWVFEREVELLALAP